jgi:DNA-directed RNA polymerase specialized sigma24 family protein
LQALSPAEQDEVADILAREMESLSDDQRAAFMETLDSGFFPTRVSEGVKAQLSQ